MNNDKFTTKTGEMQLITNEELHCNNCVFAYKDRTIDCIMYEQKPLSILDGGACDKKATTIEEARRMAEKQHKHPK